MEPMRRSDLERAGPARLPGPEPGPEAAAIWCETHLADLAGDDAAPSAAFRGGQRAADAALAAFSVAGYAARRNEVWPEARRGASKLSPYIRHGLLPLRRVWRAVEGGPRRDVDKLRDELLWQEYARHLYARLGERLREPLRATGSAREADLDQAWPAAMACMALAREELEGEGWLPNQTRMWMASQLGVRHRMRWQAGEDHFFRHLLDGSRAANRLGWQWTVGTGNGKAYGFSRWQVEKRAPGLCASCALEPRCPISDWPADGDLLRETAPEALRRDPDPGRTRGPTKPELRAAPQAVWLTAESLGDAEPALSAWPDLPAVFVFDAPLLSRLRLSRKRLVFLVETLAELGRSRSLELWRGDPAEVLGGRPLATTFTPVPGGRRLREALDVVALHPWPWLVEPVKGPIGSFSQWRKSCRKRR
jgi:deoxyribodipyrimidine photo-lyase